MTEEVVLCKHGVCVLTCCLCTHTVMKMSCVWDTPHPQCQISAETFTYNRIHEGQYVCVCDSE